MAVDYPDLKSLLLKKFHFVEKCSFEMIPTDKKMPKDLIIGARIVTLIKEESMTLPELTEMLGISRQAVHKNVTKMVELGVVFYDDPENKKRKRVRLTPKGKEILQKRAELMEQVEAKIAEKIGREKVELLREILMEEWG